MPATKIIRSFTLIVFLVWSIDSLSQSKKIDSLKSTLINAREDTVKFRIYYNIAMEYWIGLPDTIDFVNTFKYEDSAFHLAKKLNYQYGIFDCLMCYGNVYAYQHKLTEAKRYFNEAIEAVKLIGDKKMLADSYFEFAGDFFQYGLLSAKNSAQNFPIALDYFFKSLKSYEAISDKKRMADCWLTIGKLYSWQLFFNMGNGNALEIEKSATNALKLFGESKEKNEVDIATCIFFKGKANYFKGEYAYALESFLVSLKSFKDSSIKPSISGTYLNIGRVYKGLADSAFARGNKAYSSKMLSESFKYLQLSLDLYTELKFDAYIALCYLYIGTNQIDARQYTLAKENLNKAILYTEKLNGGGSYQEIYQSLAKVDSAEGNYKLALKHYNMYMAYKESNFNNTSIFESLNYKLQYEFDKKEDSLKQKQLITETKLNAEKKQKYLYWAGLVLLALLSFFVFINFRNQKKINRLASEAYAKEKTELELQSLRAQLNPHFIFNCINSIDAFIHSNDKYNATVYLNKFARLLRNILDSSKLTTVSFSKDIDTLKLYVELEELRHENKFSTIFHIENELLNNDYKVPALIIQPFVENAILHGLKNREDNNGLLQIEIRKVQGSIEYIIKDNGIGRKAAAMIAQNKEASYGMQMSSDRIRLFNKEEKPSVQINDLYQDSMATGTEVKVLLNII